MTVVRLMAETTWVQTFAKHQAMCHGLPEASRTTQPETVGTLQGFDRTELTKELFIKTGLKGPV
jgi:hypothetical protein